MNNTTQPTDETEYENDALAIFDENLPPDHRSAMCRHWPANVGKSTLLNRLLGRKSPLSAPSRKPPAIKLSAS